MALADETVLTEGISQQTEVSAVETAETAKEKPVSKAFFHIFEGIASAGELFFEALMKIVYTLAGLGKRVGAAVSRGWKYVSKRLVRFFDKAARVVIMPIYRYGKAFKMGGTEISKAKDEKGFIGGAAASARVAKRVVFGKRGIAVTVVNWALPIISCIFLFNVISFANSQTYALKLTVNGDFIGYISDETVFTSAEKMVQKRINYTGSNTDVITFEPSYEVDVIGYGKTLNNYQVTDKILGLLYDDIREGYGLYIGDVYFGTLESHNTVDIALDSLLDKFRTDNPKESVAFEKEISFIPGKYMKDSFVDESDTINLLTSNKQVASYYTVQEGDSAALICDKVDMTMSELAQLNPGFSADYAVYGGQQIKITQDEPFLNIVITREEHYDDVLPFSTQYNEDASIYEGYQLNRVTGKNGSVAVVANVSYINGVEVNRQILSRVVTKEPVTQIVSVGIKPLDSGAGAAVTVEEGKFRWPVGGVDGGSISEYPWFHGGYYNHQGLDIAAPYGTPIYAGLSGTVTTVKYSNYGYGNHVVIHHDNGMDVTYGHMSTISSTMYVGKRVTMGECIGYVGSTGQSTGNHLHFEVRLNGKVLDPLLYLPEHKKQATAYYVP